MTAMLPLTALTYTCAGADLITITDELWFYEAQLLPLLERVRSRARVSWTPAGILKSVDGRKRQMWAMVDGLTIRGIWVTEIDGPCGRIVICAGRMKGTYPAYEEVIEPWFKSQGCEYLEVIGRTGWTRVMKGFEEKAVLLQKVI